MLEFCDTEGILALLDAPDGTIALLVRSRGQLTELIRALRARGISWRANDIDPLLDRLRDRTLVVGSLSKSHAMTGSRLGWLIGPEEAIAHVDFVEGGDGWEAEAGEMAHLPDDWEQDYHLMVLSLRDYLRKSGWPEME